MPAYKDNSNSSLSVTEGVESSDSINPERHRQLKKRQNLTSWNEEKYFEEIRSGNRKAISRAITLIESTREDHQELARKIIEKCLPCSGNSIRIGITGAPGVGKSTFIESLGNLVTEKGGKLAVLTVDPSSSRSKGSILGDKVRMESLANNPNAFIRPSPAAGSLGGVAHKTHEIITLCEAAGYDTIFIETVGVGQSEIAVHSMVDFFLLLMLAGAGDELQGMKRGIIEMADLLVINKIDSSSKNAIHQTKLAFKNALNLYPEAESGWKPKVTACSALKETGIGEVWGLTEDYFSMIQQNGYFERRRNRQTKQRMYEMIDSRLKSDFYNNSEVKKALPKLEEEVLNGEISAFEAGRKLLKLYKGF